REERAAVEFAMLSLEPRRPPDIYQQRRAELIQKYAGTQTALLSEMDSVSSWRDRQTRLARLDLFIGPHAGTIAGAKALYLKGGHLHTRGPRPGFDGGDDAPTDAFPEVLHIVDILESGGYPPCEWVTRAPSLIVEFYTFMPVYRAGSVDRMLAGY